MSCILKDTVPWRVKEALYCNFLFGKLVETFQCGMSIIKWLLGGAIALRCRIPVFCSSNFIWIPSLHPHWKIYVADPQGQVFCKGMAYLETLEVTSRYTAGRAGKFGEALRLTTALVWTKSKLVADEQESWRFKGLWLENNTGKREGNSHPAESDCNSTVATVKGSSYMKFCPCGGEDS